MCTGVEIGGVLTMVSAYMRWYKPAEGCSSWLVGGKGGEELAGVYNHHLRRAGRTIRVC